MPADKKTTHSEKVFIPPFLQIDFQITGRCNSRCRFCNCWKNPYPSEKDIPGIVWIDVIKRLQGFTTIEYFCIGGGEPLLYKDIFNVLKALSEQNVETILVSNGSLFSYDTCLRLFDTGMKNIDFSIDGFENTHDRLRGKPGLFNKCVDSICLLKKLNPKMSLGISSLICGENINELPGFVEWVLRELPIDRINFQALQQVTDYRDKDWWKKSDIWPNDEKMIINSLDFLAKKTQEEKRILNHPVQCEKFKKYFLSPETDLGIDCPAGTFNFSVSHTGDVIGCIADGPVGNISFQDPIRIYREKFPAVRRKASGCKENCHFLINCYFPLHWSRWNNLVKDMVRQEVDDVSKPGKVILPPEIRMVISTENKKYPDLIKYNDHKRHDTLGKVNNFESRKLPEQYNENTPIIYLCGNNSETHRWSVGLDENDYYRQIEKLKLLSSDRCKYHIVVGVGRTNFFKLDKVWSLIHETRDSTTDNVLPGFSLAPFGGIRDRFHKYLKEINYIGKKEGVEFKIVDKKFNNFLNTVSNQAHKDYFSEPDFLRALGPVCKDVFAGPKYILLDISGECNVDCVYCRRFSKWNKDFFEKIPKDIKGFMNIDVINNILSDAKKSGAETVLLVGGSEPTLHPEFKEIIYLIKKYGLKFNFSTNGTLLERFNNYITDGSCEAVTVSLSFASEETFKKIRPNSSPGLIGKITKGVKGLSELKKMKKIHAPKIHALYALCAYNYHEIIPMVEFAKELGVDSVWFQMVHLEDFSKGKLRISPDKIGQVSETLQIAKERCRKYGIEFASFIDFELDCFNERKGDWSKAGLLEQGCFVGWHFVFVHLRSEIFFCCGPRVIGFLDNQGNGLNDVWFSDTYRRYRNDGLIMHQENPITLYGSPLYDRYCDSCDNHDQNTMMIELLKKYELLPFVERYNSWTETSSQQSLQIFEKQFREDIKGDHENEKKDNTSRLDEPVYVKPTLLDSESTGLKLHHPSPGMDILLVVTPPWGVGNPHIGLAYLSSYLRKKGFIVHTYDMNIEMFNSSKEPLKKYWNVEHYSQWGKESSLEKLINIFSQEIENAVVEVLNHNTPAIGLTSTYSNLPFVLYLAKRIKKHKPDVKIIVGGSGTNSESSRSEIIKSESTDCIIVGEGEKKLQYYLNYIIHNNRSIDKLPGMLFKRNDEFSSLKSGPLNIEIDDLFYPDFFGLELASYTERSLPIIFSRGCKGNCSFCEISLLWHTFRSRTPENILEEFEFHVRHNKTNKFRNFDSSISQVPEVLNEVINGLIRKGLGVEWDGSFIAQKGLTKEFFAKLFSAGCKTLYFGLESGSDEILQLMRKPFKVEWAEENIRFAADAGIKVFLNIIVGFPGETEEDFNKTLNFIAKNRNFIDSIGGATALQLVENTYLYKHREKYNIRIPKDNFNYLWETKDNLNTFEIRQNRLLTLLKLLNELGINLPVCASLNDGKDTVTENEYSVSLQQVEHKTRKENIDLLLISAPPWDVGSPPLNLFALKSYLNKQNCRADVYDLNIELYNQASESYREYWNFENTQCWLDPVFLDRFFKEHRHIIENLIIEALSTNPHIIGFSMVDQKTAFLQRFIALLSARKNNNTKIIIGGPSCFDTKSIEQVSLIFNSTVDGYVLQEGEFTLEEIIRKERNNQSLCDIAGFSIPGQTGDFKYRKIIKDLNQLPFAEYEGVGFGKYNTKSIALNWSRGCTGNCSFCNVRRMWNKFRFRSVESIIKEIKYHLNVNNIRDFAIFDSMVNYNIHELNKICDAIIEEGLDISWYALAIPRKKMTAELFGKLKRAGCYRLEFGIESGSYNVLKDMKKLFDPETAGLNLKLAHDAGIECGICLIAGYPTESEDDFAQTLKFLEQNKKYIKKVSQVNSLCILKGTYLHDNYRDFNIHFPEKDESLKWFCPRNNYKIRKGRVARIKNKIKELGIEYVKSNIIGESDVHSETNQNVCPSLPKHGENLKPVITLTICPPWGIDHPPMSIGYLAQYLKDHEIGYQIFDLNIELFNKNKESQKDLWNVENDYIWRITPPLEMISKLDWFDGLVDELAALDTPVVGFSLIDPNQFIACEVIKRIKKKCPDKIIVTGGPVCSTPEERKWLKEKTDNLIDYIVAGEGEVPLTELLNKLNSAPPASEIEIPGIVDCRYSNCMEPYSTCMSLDLNMVSFPDYEGFNLSLYATGIASVMWSRGCTANCSFCKEKSLWEQYRNRAIKSILDEIKFYKEKGIDEFVVYDSLVNGNPGHLAKLCDAIIEENLNIRWSALAIPDRFLKKELLKKLKMAGCFVLIFGIESGSEKVLKLMRKGFLLKDAMRVLKDTKDVGIKTAVNILVGFPGETDDDFEKTLDFIRNYHEHIDRIDAITPLQLVRGTYLYNHYREFAIRLPDDREHECWTTADGLNNYEIRMGRCRKIEELCRNYNIEIGKIFTERKSLQQFLGRDETLLYAELNKMHKGDLLFLNLFFSGMPDYDTAVVMECLKQDSIKSFVITKNKPSDNDELLIKKLGGVDVPFVAVKVPEEQSDRTAEAIKSIRHAYRNFKIILWGSGCRTEGQRRKLPLDSIDIIIPCEYERSFKNLITNSQKIRTNQSIPGIYIPHRPFIPLAPLKDISTRPFPRYTECDPDSIHSMLPIRLSWGCPHRCAYCSVYFEEGPFRVRNPEVVCQEIRHHVKNNSVTHFAFLDRSICGNTKTLQKFCRTMIQEQSHVRWQARYIPVTDGDGALFREMADAGCRKLDFGFICGSNSILQVMGKSFNVNTLEKGLKGAKESGILTSVKLMMGFPGEEETNFRGTVSFLLKNRQYIDEVLDIVPCHIQPGCDLEKAPHKYGLVLPAKKHWRDWHNGSCNNYSYRLKKTKEMIIFLEEIGLTSDIHQLIEKEDPILNDKDRIFERMLRSGEELLQQTEPEPHGSLSPVRDDDPVVRGICSNSEVYAGPEILEIDLTNNCNLQCIGCWCHSPLLGEEKFSGEEKKKHLPTEKVINLVREAASLGTRMVQLSGAGEPFLHPGIWNIIRAVKKHNMDCTIITNFSRLDRDGVRLLVELGVDAITASIWAGDRRTYERIHPGAGAGLFNSLKENLSSLTAIRGNKRLPELKIYNVITSHNADGIEEMIEFALDVGADAIEFQMVDTVSGKTDTLLPDENAIKRLVSQLQELRNRPDYLSEFIGTDHLEIIENHILREELKEFGRIYPRFPKGFIFMPELKAARCLNRIGSRDKIVSSDDFSVAFVFNKDDCKRCSHSVACSSITREKGRLVVYPMSILGVGSFLRRLTYSERQMQEYERKIIDLLPCTVGWTYARITVEGNVIPCCKAGDFSLGNVHEKSFEQIWGSSAYDGFRHRAKNLPKCDSYFNVINCYKSCDNVGMNLMTHLKLLSCSKRI